MQETQFNSWVGKVPWRRGRLPTAVFLHFPDGSDSEDSTCNVGDLGLTLGWEDPLEGMATHSSILSWRNPMDRGAWQVQSMGLQRVGHDSVTKHSTVIPKL